MYKYGSFSVALSIVDIELMTNSRVNIANFSATRLSAKAATYDQGTNKNTRSHHNKLIPRLLSISMVYRGIDGLLYLRAFQSIHRKLATNILLDQHPYLLNW